MHTHILHRISYVVVWKQLVMSKVVLIASVVPCCIEGPMWCLCQELNISDCASCYEHYHVSRATLHERLYMVVTPVKLLFRALDERSDVVRV